MTAGTMRALRAVSPCSLETLAVVNRPVPAPGPNEVLVRWHAASLNYHDYIVCAGVRPIPLPEVIPLSDAAGEVVAVGGDVQRWKVGDGVMSLFFPDWSEGIATPERVARVAGDTCQGYGAEYGVVAESALTRIPEGYRWAEAACLPCAGLTAWRGLFAECDLRAGETVLVEGTGGVSIFALQMAKAAGATVFATTSSTSKAERLLSLGADEVINYRECPDWGAQAFQRSGGVDVVVDVGGTTLDQSIAACRIGGRVASIGLLGGYRAELAVSQMLKKQIHLHSLMVGSRSQQERMVETLEAHRIRPVIDREFAMTQVAEAFAYQAAGQHFGKIVIRF